jgi:hypothetical protein
MKETRRDSTHAHDATRQGIRRCGLRGSHATSTSTPRERLPVTCRHILRVESIDRRIALVSQAVSTAALDPGKSVSIVRGLTLLSRLVSARRSIIPFDGECLSNRAPSSAGQ